MGYLVPLAYLNYYRLIVNVSLGHWNIEQAIKSLAKITKKFMMLT
jgi:hypothetical protein